MPGIAGVVFPDAFHVDRLTGAMLENLAHRGSQPREEHLNKNIQVGITGDILATWQEIVVGLDGHVYGADVLRKNLVEHGYAAEKASDALLIAYAYHLFGIESLAKIDGDFAFFILDKNKGQIFLVRDRIGKKPLYWYQDSKYLFFASELKGILANHIVPQSPSNEGLSTYLFFGYTPQDFSPINGINKLLPGYYLQCDRDNSKLIKPYWSYSSCFQKKNPEINNIDEVLNDMLLKAIKERTPQLESLGTFISGGLGSASIAYYLKKIAPDNSLKAFTVGFENETTADMKAAAQISAILNIPQQEEIITPKNLLDNLVKVAWHLDEPLADPNVIATWRLAALASSTQTVFSGMGCDELLAGHERYTTEERKVKKRSWMGFVEELCLPFLKLFSEEQAYRILQRSQTNPMQLNFFQNNALFDETLMREAAPELLNFFNVHRFLLRFNNLGKIPSMVSTYLYLDIKTRLPDCYMLQYERLTTAHQLDWKTPFLSQDIIEYLASMPEPEELKSSDTSRVLKKILKNQLPKDFLSRPKKTRPKLLEPWVEISGLGKLFQTLPNGLLVEYNLISKKWLQTIVGNADSRKYYFRQLWALLMLEVWMRLYIYKPIRESAPDITVQELLMEG